MLWLTVKNRLVTQYIYDAIDEESHKPMAL
jgi:hypothetical protein